MKMSSIYGTCVWWGVYTHQQLTQETKELSKPNFLNITRLHTPQLVLL